MPETWQSALDRWSSAGLVDAATIVRIRSFEAAQDQLKHFRWPILIAIGFGALTLAAGVLLFVSAHWDDLSPSGRFFLVLTLVAIFHVAGAIFSERFPALSTALHGVGTAALGAGIFLSAQIFNLQEHWPGGVMLWALGAWIGWGLRRDWRLGSGRLCCASHARVAGQRMDRCHPAHEQFGADRRTGPIAFGAHILKRPVSRPSRTGTTRVGVDRRHYPYSVDDFRHSGRLVGTGPEPILRSALSRERFGRGFASSSCRLAASSRSPDQCFGGGLDFGSGVHFTRGQAHSVHLGRHRISRPHHLGS